MSLHMAAPSTKFLRMLPTSVVGMQNTPRSKSLTARFSKNTLVTVLILLRCTNVRITSEFPTTAHTKMTAYSKILNAVSKLMPGQQLCPERPQTESANAAAAAVSLGSA